MKIQRFKEMLKTKAQELNRNNVSRDEIAIGRNAELLDEIQQTADRELALAALTRNWQTLSQVEAALGRIADGTFGTCQECEEAISERRLAAIPWAMYCIRCQELMDGDERRSEIPLAA